MLPSAGLAMATATTSISSVPLAFIPSSLLCHSDGASTHAVLLYTARRACSRTSCIDRSFFLRVVVVIVIPPGVVVSVAAQSFESGSDIDTSNRGIIARNSVEYGMALESTLAFAPSFSRS